jgi:hypothetical protein
VARHVRPQAERYTAPAIGLVIFSYSEFADAMMEAGPMKVLKSRIAVGLKDLDHGRFRTYDDAEQLVDDICRRGRIRLNGLRLKVAAKVHGKKK